MNRIFRLIAYVALLGSFGASAQTGSLGTFTNGDFETGNFTGWTEGGGYWRGEWPINPSTYLPGGSNFNLSYKVNNVLGPGPITDPRTGGKLQIIYSGDKTAKVNDEVNNNSISVISQTVSNYTDSHIYFAWAAVLEGSHGPTDSDNFTLQLKDVTTGEDIYQVAYNSALAASQSLFTKFNDSNTGRQWFYTTWQVQNLDVSARRGHTFTLTLLAADCPYGGHAGYVYLDGFGAITPPTGTGPAGGPLTVTSSSLGTVLLGNSISGSVGVSGGTPPYSWTTGGDLPAGLSASGGSISGMPVSPGNYGVTLIVTDAAGNSTSGSITFSVFGFTSTSLPAGIVFSPYSGAAAVAGGTPPYTFSFSGLPSGLGGNSAGNIQGIVTAPSSSQVLVVATDSTGVSASARQALLFSLAPPLAVTTSKLPSGTVGQVYSQLLTGAFGGAPPYSWSVSSGALPDGLALRPGGTVAGNPSRVGTFSFGVRVTDVTGASAVGATSLTIMPVPLVVTAPTLSSGITTTEFPRQVFSASGGTPPYRFALTSGTLPAGMFLDTSGALGGTPQVSGSFPITVTATDSALPTATTGVAGATVVVRPLSTDLILSTGSVDFSLIAGTSQLPAGQLVAVQSSRAAIVVPYTVAVSPASANWFTVPSASSSTPGSLNVSLNSRALALAASAAPYQAMVSVTCQSPAPCVGSSQIFNVNLTVMNAVPQLNILSDLLSFSATPGTAQALTQTLGLQNAGGGSIGFASVGCAASWCSVSGVPGSISAGQTANVNVSVNPSALTAGYYRTTITVMASTGVATVPVSVFIAGSPSVSLQPAGEQFQALSGGTPNGPLSSFLVDVSGSATVNWTASVQPGAAWLTVPVTSGSASATQPGTVSFKLDPGIIAGLAPKTYYGLIRVNVTGVTNSPQDFEVVLDIGPANGSQRPNPSPAGLLFITQANGTPAPQTVTISTNSVFPVDNQVSVFTSDGAGWLSVAPVTGQAQPTRPLLTQVSVNPSKLAPGVYTGGVNYAFSGLAVRTVNVTLIVSPAPKTSARSGFGLEADAPACVPTQMAAAQIGLVNSFSQPTAWPTPLQIILVNDCGGAITNGQIIATFSNNDPPLPLNLADPRSGLYSATWTPRRTSQQTAISMVAKAAGFAPVTVLLAGSVTSNASPLLDRNSTQHVFNPLVGGALAPGNLVQITGSDLALKSATATAPLPTTLNGTQVLIGGVAAPIAAVSPTALSVEIPAGLTPGMQYQVLVAANGAITTPDFLQLTATAPGVATGLAGLVSASHLDGSAVTEASPAAPGEALVMVAAGLGLTDPPVADGAAAPATPLANALSVPSLTIDGAPAAISFAGLQPGAVGIYQIKFTVPAGARNGDLTLIVSQDGQPGNTTVLPVQKKKV